MEKLSNSSHGKNWEVSYGMCRTIISLKNSPISQKIESNVWRVEEVFETLTVPCGTSQ